MEFPALNARPAKKLDEWLTRIEHELGEYKVQKPDRKASPDAVNQVCHYGGQGQGRTE